MLRPKYLAGARHAGHRRRQHTHRVRFGNRCIVVSREHHAALHAPAGRRDVLGTLWAKDVAEMVVAPVKMCASVKQRFDGRIAAAVRQNSESIIDLCLRLRSRDRGTSHVI
jgi:hypothetical protein